MLSAQRGFYIVGCDAAISLSMLPMHTKNTPHGTRKGLAMFRTRIAATLCALLVSAIFASNAFAQGFPNRPIRFVVPWPPGGGTDALARIVAQAASDGLGQPVVVDNRGGGGTIIGNNAVAKSTPDGYTFGFPTQSFAVNATLQPTLPYDTKADFDPVMLLGTGVYVLVVNASVPANTLPELIALMKKQPEKFNAGFTGFGSPSHLGLVQFKRATGTAPAEINYRGTGPAVSDLIGGQTQLMFTTLAGVLPNVRAGSLKIIAVTSRNRSALLPETPTAIEAGLSDFVVFEWYGVHSPKGTPREAISRVNAEVKRVLTLPDVLDRTSKMGIELTGGSTPEEFAAFLNNEIEKWGNLVRYANIKPE